MIGPQNAIGVIFTRMARLSLPLALAAVAGSIHAQKNVPAALPPQAVAPSTTGTGSAYYHYGLQAWDIAAALLLIQEAGGVVTDWSGKPRMSGAGGAVAAGKALHPILLDLLQSNVQP